MGWNLSNASYDNVSFSVNNEDSIPTAVAFKSDGSKFYMMGWATDTIYQYSLSTDWDISTASYDNVSSSIGSIENLPVAMFFKADGSKVYISGQHFTIYQCVLSTPWDISTISYDNKSLDVSGQNWNPYGIHFKPDGAKMYIVNQDDSGDARVYQYSLSTSWNVSTASYDNVNFDISSQGSGAWYYDIQFNSDGTKFYVVDDDGYVYQYSLSTDWDISTASYDVSFNVSDQDGYMSGIDFNSDGTKMYLIGQYSDAVHQYSIAVAEVTTEAASSVGIDHAKGNGTASGGTITERGFEVRLAFEGTLYEYISHSIAGFEGTASYVIADETWQGTLTKTITETGTFDEGAFTGDLGKFPIAVSSDKLFPGETYDYRAYAIIDGDTYYGDYVEFTTNTYPADYILDDLSDGNPAVPIIPITAIEPIELLYPAVYPIVYPAFVWEPSAIEWELPELPSLPPWDIYLPELPPWIYWDFPELPPLPPWDLPDLLPWEYPDYPSLSFVGDFYYRKPYTKRDLDELRKKCIIFNKNSVDLALVLRHNMNVLREFFNELSDNIADRDEFNQFRDVIPTQHLKELYLDSLKLNDFKDIINSFLVNSADNNMNINHNFKLIQDGLTDYETESDDAYFEEISNTVKTVTEDNPDVHRLKKVMDSLNQETSSNFSTIMHNLKIIKARLL